MADLVLTPANVKPTAANSQTKLVTAGEALTQGEVVYYDSTTKKYFKADADLSAAASTAVGIALTPAGIDAPCVIQTGGDINVGATLTKGELYCVSATAGNIAPFADLGSGDWICFLGVAKSTSEIVLSPQYRGVQI